MNSSTIGLDSWAVDLANVSAVYPFQGAEVIMTLIGVGLWILWHIIQLGAESSYYTKKIQKYGNAETIRKAIDRDHSM